MHLSTNVVRDFDIVGLTVEDVQSGFADGTFTAEELTKSCIERIERYNKRYNAIIFMNPSALDDARAIDKRRAAGEKLGPLAGVPVVVKDAMDMIDFPTTAGWKLLCSKAGGVDMMPATDAPVVARMRAAGAIILGKTNVPVLSHSGAHANDSWAGPTLNVTMPDRLPGGSSAGTAAAVASSMVVLGLAEETGGSIQNPASAQDLVGIKPTIGLVPNAGVVPLASNRDVVGPIAKCVRDAALCLDALAGYTIEDPKTLAGVGKQPAGGYTSKLRADALKGKRLGLYGRGWRNQPMSTECAKLYDRAKGELEKLGATLVEDPFVGTGFADLREPTPPLENFDARGFESIAYDVQKYLERHGPNATIKNFADFAKATEKENAFGPKGVLSFMPSLPQFRVAIEDPIRPPDISEFISLKKKYLLIFEETFARHRLDACVFPQMLEELGDLQSKRGIRETTVGEINIAGVPGVNVPAGYYASGSPFSLIFVGHLWSEAELLAYAYAYETATGHRKEPTLDA